MNLKAVSAKFYFLLSKQKQNCSFFFYSQFTYDFAGARFPATGNQDKEKDVVPKYEDKANSSWYHNCHNSHYCSFSLWWLQLF